MPQTDGRQTTDDRRRTNFDFMSSADIVKQSLKNCQKSKIWNSTILYTTLVESPFLGVCMNFWEQIYCALSDKMSLEFFSLIWSHVNEKEKKIANKRPRNLDALLGHLLVKRILVMYKLISYYKNPWIFKSKVHTRSSKLEMHRMTPIWTWTLNNEKYSAGNKDLPLRLKFWSILLYDYCYQDIKLAKIGNATNNPILNLNT